MLGGIHRTDLLSSMLPKYKELLKRDLAILIFSGDVDGIVPVRSLYSLEVFRSSSIRGTPSTMNGTVSGVSSHMSAARQCALLRRRGK